MIFDKNERLKKWVCVVIALAALALFYREFFNGKTVLLMQDVLAGDWHAIFAASAAAAFAIALFCAIGFAVWNVFRR